MGSRVGHVHAAALLTPHDAAALLGGEVERLEPTAAGATTSLDDFVCFGGRDVRTPIVGELVSLASAPGVRRDHDVPFFVVAVESTRGSAGTLARRTVSAKWEQAGTRFALTYTCPSPTPTTSRPARGCCASASRRSPAW